MKSVTIALTLALAQAASQAAAYDEGTHHLCDGLYAHKEKDDSWRLIRSRAGKVVEVAVLQPEKTETVKKIKAALIADHCEPGEHPDVHE